MKKTILSILFLVFALTPVLGKNRVIDNPAYEVKNSGIDNIVKIELSKTATRVYVKTTFLPNWWIKFPTTTFIEPEGSNEKLFATGIERGGFDKEIYMPASGDSLFVLIFPPLDKSVKKFNYGEDKKTMIFGISLEKIKTEKKRLKNEVPDHIQTWLSEELENATLKEALPDYQSDNFFTYQPGRLVGYIKGYDPRLGFSTGIIYASNVITREDYPVSLNIHPNGRFEADIPMQHPTSFYLSINDKPFLFYMEPGHTLAMILDWEEFLIADRLRNTQYKFKNTEFIGTLAEINSELSKIELRTDNWREKEEKQKTLNPAEYKTHEQMSLDENLEFIHQKSTEHSLSGKTVALLTNEAFLVYGTNHLDYVMSRERLLREDPDNQIFKSPIPDDYYDFLQQMSLNDQVLLTSVNSSSFINRFEYCEPFFAVWTQLTFNPEKTFIRYLEEEHKDTWTDEDEKIKAIQEQLNLIQDKNERIKYYEANKTIFEAFEAFEERHKSERELYSQYFEIQIKAHQKERNIKEIRLRDSIFTNVLHLTKPNLIYDITKVRRLEFDLKKLLTREDAEEILFATTRDIQNHFVIKEAFRMYNQAYPEDNKTTYDLPETESGILFSKMIAPLKGKYIVVDFWESWCGPCIAGIKDNKALRERLKDSNDITFLFICSEDTPEDTYKEYVEEQGLENSHRLTKDQYIRMRELFKFNGIPHYEYVNREGQMMTKGLDIDRLESSLNNLLKEENEK